MATSKQNGSSDDDEEFISKITFHYDSAQHGFVFELDDSDDL